MLATMGECFVREECALANESAEAAETKRTIMERKTAMGGRHDEVGMALIADVKIFRKIEVGVEFGGELIKDFAGVF